ncbi:hypothetical protein L0F63_004300, partial [Massospora cicadina]
ERVDGGTASVEEWHRDEHNGRICVLQDGKVFEKAGVTYSVVKDKLTEARRVQLNQRGWNIPPGENPYLATGLSLVFHPHNPFAPTVHLNYRYFEVGEDKKPSVWWFGGGSDLTPCYFYKEDAIHFHRVLKEALDPHGDDLYPRFKTWCDEYFYIPHREEHRGIGGVFFDDFTSKQLQVGEEGGFEAAFNMVKDVAKAFIPAYFPIIERRCLVPYSAENKHWQQIRRGRYVEFNLIYDRGTQFGLKVPGICAENILVSLPLTARWEFDYSPEPDTPEAKSLE